MNPELLDPRTVTENDVREMLENSYKGEYDDRTYIPVRTNTPQSLIYWAEKRRGDVIDDNPIIMSVKKIYQAMSRSGADIDGRPHEFSADDIISIIRKMNDPEYIVYQEFNDRYAEVVKCTLENGKKAIVILEIGNYKRSSHVNSFEDGTYNVLVTAYPPDSGKIEDLIKKNSVIYDKKKDASQVSSGSTVPSVLNDTPFYEDSITQPESDVNRENIKMSRRTNPETRATLEALEAADWQLRKRGINTADVLKSFEDKLGYHAGDLSNFELQTSIIRTAVAVEDMKSGKKNTDIRNEVIDVVEPLAKELVVNDVRNFYLEADKEQFRNAQNKIKEIKLNLSENIRKSFESEEEFNTFIKKHSSKMSFADKDGMDIDTAYVELNDMYGGDMFPERIIDEFGQLMQIARISEAYLGGKTNFVSESAEDMIRSTQTLLYEVFMNAKEEQKINPRYFLLDTVGSEIHTAEEYNNIRIYRKNVDEASKLDALRKDQESDIRQIRKDIESQKKTIREEIERLTGAKRETENSVKKALERSGTEGGKLSELISKRKELQDKYNVLNAEYNVTKNRLNEIDGALTKLKSAKPLTDLMNRRIAEKTQRILERKNAELKRKDERIIRKREQLIRERADNKLKRQALREKQKKLTAEKNETVKSEIAKHDLNKLRENVRSKVKSSKDMLLKPTKSKHIPENMRPAVAAAIDAIDGATMIEHDFRQDERTLEKARREMERAREMRNQAADDPDISKEDFITKYDKAFKDAKARYEELERGFHEKKQVTKEELKVSLEKLKDVIDDFRNSADPEVRTLYDETSTELMNNTIAGIKGKTFEQLNTTEVCAVLDVLDHITYRINEGNHLFADGKKSGKVEASRAICNEERMNIGKEHYRIFNIPRGYSINCLEPAYFADKCGSPTLRKIMYSVIESEDIYAKDLYKAKAFISSMKTKYFGNLSKKEMASWDPDKVFEFSFDSKTERYTLGEIMAIYETYKRGQGQPHLLGGGIIKNEKKNFVKVPKDDNFLSKINPTDHQLKLTESAQAAAYRHTESELQQIISKLTEMQKKFADEMQGFFITECAEWGNEVSMDMHGYRMYTEKDYFPIYTAKGYTKRLNDQKNSTQTDLTQRRFTKTTVYGANNAIVIKDFMQTWAEHVNEMAAYHAFARPVSDLKFVLGFSETLDTENVKADQNSVWNLLNRSGGAGTAEYIEQFIRDINGGVIKDNSGKLAEMMFSRAKKGAVLHSLSSAIQQPTSICRAFAMVDPKYFAESIRMPNHHTVNLRMEEMKKYAPVAILKEIGGVDVGMGKTAVNYLVGKETLLDKFDRLGGALMEKGDAFTWRWIWEACKREQASKTGLSLKSEELLTLAGKRFSDVVRRTQVYDSVMSKSGIMRSSNFLNKLATSFAAEPIKTANMMIYATEQFRSGNKKTAFRYGLAVYASIVLSAAAKSFPYAARDDDEDKTYWEKYIEALTGSLAGDVLPVSWFPYARDVWSILQGYGIDRNDMSLYENLYNKLLNMFGDDPLGWKIADLTTAVAGVWGIPAENFIREIKAILNFVKSVPEWSDTTFQGITNAALQGLEDARPTILGKMIESRSEVEKRTDRLYDAIVSGNSKEKRRIEEILGSEGTINTAIKNGLRRKDERIAGAALDILRGDYRRMKDTVSEITGEKNFTAQQISDAVYAEKNAIERRIKQAAQAKIDGDESGRIDVTLELKSDYRKYFDSTTKAQDFFVNAVNKKADELKKSGESAASEEDGEGTSYYTPYKAYQVADKLDSGDVTAAAEIAEDIVQAKIESGKTEKEARASVRSSVTRYFKPLYQAAYKNRDSAEMTRIRKLLMQSKLYGGSTETSKVCRRWTEE